MASGAKEEVLDAVIMDDRVEDVDGTEGTKAPTATADARMMVAAWESFIVGK